MVRMKDEDLVHGAGKDRVDVIILAGTAKHIWRKFSA